MHARLWLTLGLGLTLSAPASAATVVLAWEWPHRLGTPTWHLTLTSATPQGSREQTLTLTAFAPDVCKGHVGTDYAQDETWCASLTVQAPGAYSAVLRAGESDPSNTLRFSLTPDAKLAPYEAGDLVAPVPTETPTPAPQPTSPPPEPEPELPPLPTTLTPTEPPEPPPAINPNPVPEPLPADPPLVVPPSRSVPWITPPPAAPAQPRDSRMPSASGAPVEPVTPRPDVPSITTGNDLQGQLNSLLRSYDAAQDRIVEAYLHALATRTPQAAQQAYVAGSAQLEQLYAATLQAWQQLYDAWLGLPPQP